MEIFAMFTVIITMLLLFFCVVMLIDALFCYIIKRCDKNGKVNPQLRKWVEVLDWLKEEKK